MGVNGLWTVLQPCARPIKLETLNKKRLAVDASIWIYQFLKAVRDKEGNALRNSHVVGFFRRICKLLFFGIKPVFVFDGGAPALKRQTIAARKRRREGRREDAVRTAGKLLALQVQRRAEEEQERRRQARDRQVHDEDEQPIPEDAVYVDELLMTQHERRQNRQFKRTDQYHLPDLEGSLETMGAPDDPRVMSQEELEEYARQFSSGEDVNLYDFSKIDFDSPFFLSLPAPDRYNILNAARLRSRLRMGYSKDQLDTMFPDRMAFSKFQIERVTERNDLTQRLMHLNGADGADVLDPATGAARIAGEKGREYVLVKNSAVEGGWALGVVSGSNEGDRNKPINVDTLARKPTVADDDDDDGRWEDENHGFEDVPIEGLNRLPKVKRPRDPFPDGVADRRRALYEARRKTAGAVDEQDSGEPDSLFVDADDGGAGDEVRDLAVESLFDEPALQRDYDEEEDELKRAIAMSLDSNYQDQSHQIQSPDAVQDGRDNVEIVESPRAPNLAAKDVLESGTAGGFPPEDDGDDDMDLHAALANARQTAARSGNAMLDVSSEQQKLSGAPSARVPAKQPQADPFVGPLPFEKFTSVSTQTHVPDNAGGFEHEPAESTQKKSLPLPPWFSGNVRQDLQAQEALEQRQTRDAGLGRDNEPPVLQTHQAQEVIEIESDDESPKETVTGAGAAALRAFSEPERTETVHGHETRAIEEDPSHEEDATTAKDLSPGANSVRQLSATAETRSPSPEFEDVMPSADVTSIERAAEEGQALLPTSPSPAEEADPADLGIKEEGADEYSDPEDDQLFQQLAAEADEHARFASSLNHKSKAQNHEDYERELRALRSQQKKDRRDADEVNNIMITECQQLLTLFGLPYITAPMEAEAQCAELVRLGLVDGIVTDDSDCFLFGGTRIYKNTFNQAKFVECYLANDLEREFDLDRHKLVRFAHLLGSDYTDGIPGVGPVTALEILSEFNSDTGLEDFRDWWQGVQTGVKEPGDTKSPFRKKFRRNAARVFLPPAFPSSAVTEAYLHPEVDSSAEVFQWGVPDLDAIRGFLMSTIGWSKERTDEVLVPVIRDMNRREHEGTQSNLTAFFSGGTGAGAFAPRRIHERSSRGVMGMAAAAAAATRKPASRRIEGALGKLKEGAKRKRRSAGATREGNEGESEGEGDSDDDVQDQHVNADKDAVVVDESTNGSGLVDSLDGAHLHPSSSTTTPRTRTTTTTRTKETTRKTASKRRRRGK